MGFDYALVHAKYTIPPCLMLTLLYRPLFTGLDLYKIAFLITIAVLSTIPWDSYLIYANIWSYPDDAVLGPTLIDIPIEELFFFVIQTYGTSLLYIIFSRATFKPACLPHERIDSKGKSAVLRQFVAYLGRALFAYGIWKGNHLVSARGTGTYMGLILSWACPFLLLLWHISANFALRLPVMSIALPIMLPTVYLWIVDTLALRRGTWVVVQGTKLGVTIWDGLEVEEAFFFLVTNCMVVFGLIAFDFAATLIQTFPELAPNTKYPSPIQAMKVLLASTSLINPHSAYDAERIVGLGQAVRRLRRKSRSFFLASSFFDGPLQVDLIRLYSFCRVADDLVDEARSQDEAVKWVKRMREFLDRTHKNPTEAERRRQSSQFPPEARYALTGLPLERLSRKPLCDLVDGFEIDIQFADESLGESKPWPISSATDLMHYGYAVAGTVAELCLDLAFSHHGRGFSEDRKGQLKQAGQSMGKALQTINIARDIQVDAEIGRVYIPTDWLEEEGLSPEEIIGDATAPGISQLRERLLRQAFTLYESARPSIEELPKAVRRPMRVAVESYMEIGRVLLDERHVVRPGRATVGRWRRLRTAVSALNA